MRFAPSTNVRKLGAKEGSKNSMTFSPQIPFGYVSRLSRVSVYAGVVLLSDKSESHSTLHNKGVCKFKPVVTQASVNSISKQNRLVVDKIESSNVPQKKYSTGELLYRSCLPAISFSKVVVNTRTSEPIVNKAASQTVAMSMLSVVR